MNVYEARVASCVLRLPRYTWVTLSLRADSIHPFRCFGVRARPAATAGATTAVLIWLVTGLGGCGELRGRRQVREGNRLYREGRYAQALEAYRRAEPLAGSLPLLWLNEGLTCRQLMIPGAKSAKDQQAAACALAAFQRMKAVAPADPRGDQLYIQTLFDADRYSELEKRFGGQLQRDPTDVAAVNALIQVATRSNQAEQALVLYQRKAALLPKDAEAQYAVGVFIWQQLFQRGGGPDKAAFDPRPDSAVVSDRASAAKESRRKRRRAGKDNSPVVAAKVPPAFAPGDIVGTARVTLAGRGIQYLERAMELRPQYHDALVYLNLLYRQKAVGYFEQPAAWQQAIDTAEKWRLVAAAPAAVRPPAAHVEETKDAGRGL